MSQSVFVPDQILLGSTWVNGQILSVDYGARNHHLGEPHDRSPVAVDFQFKMVAKIWVPPGDFQFRWRRGPREPVYTSVVHKPTVLTVNAESSDLWP